MWIYIYIYIYIYEGYAAISRVVCSWLCVMLSDGDDIHHNYPRREEISNHIRAIHLWFEFIRIFCFLFVSKP